MAKERLKEILAIVNDKGGVGKSTTAHNLACGLLRLQPDYRVLIVDLDAQVANVSLLCGWHDRKDKHGTMYDAMVKKRHCQCIRLRLASRITMAISISHLHRRRC